MATFQNQITLSILFLFVSISGWAQESPWKLKKETTNLQVFVREVPNSNINELKLTTTFEADLTTIAAVFKDVKAMPEWIYKCTESEWVKQEGEIDGVIYSKFDFPWPLNDRDLVARGDLVQDPQTKVLTSTMEALPNLLPLNPGVIRIPSMKIQWTFTPIAPGKVFVEYQLLSDPGGNLPGWIVNTAIDKGPIESMEGLRRLLKNPKYQNKPITSIMNL